MSGHGAAAQEAHADTSETPVAQKSTSGGTAAGTSAEATSVPATPTSTAADAVVATATEPTASEPTSPSSTDSAKEQPQQTKPVRPLKELKAMAIPLVINQSPSAAKTVPTEPAATSGENYLSTVNTPLGPCAWKHFPIKVFMPPAPVSYSQQLETDVRAGFDLWSKVTQGKISFQFVDLRRRGDMVLGWAASRMNLNNSTESGEANVDYRTSGVSIALCRTPEISITRRSLLFCVT